MPRWLSGFLVGTLVGGIAFLIGLFFIGPGHGSDLPASLLFPFNRVLKAYTLLPAPFLAGAFALQYPLYGALIAVSRPRRLGLLGVVVLHGLAVALVLMTLHTSSS